jgi:VWFA-related protein
VAQVSETIEVAIVNVDAVVTDSKGRRVRGLTRGDFEIYEDGVLQTITNFAEYAAEPRTAAEPSAAAPSTSPAATSPTAPPPQKRTVIVFVERFYLPHFSADPFFEALKKLLHQTVRPGDRAMVVFWNSGALSTRQGFTENLAALDTAVDSVAKQNGTRMRTTMDELANELDQISAFQSEAAAFNSGQSLGRTAAAELGGVPSDPLSLSTVRMYARFAMLDEKRKVRSLQALIRSIAAADGKKMLLLASHRLSTFAGLEYFEKAGVPMEARDRIDFDAKPLARSLAAIANANGVTIYPMYAEGLGTSFNLTPEFHTAGPQSRSFENEVLLNETPMLQEVAETTGGTMAWSAAEVTKLLPRIADDLESYYSLAYRASKPGAGKPRNVVVKTKDRTLRVRSRRGYSLKSDATRMEDRVLATLFGTQPASSFEIGVTVGKARREGKVFVVPVSLQIPIAALSPLPEGNDFYAGAFSVYTASGAVIGGISDTGHETKGYRIATRDIEKARKGHYTYDLELHVAGLGERVAVGVIDETSKEYALRLIELPRFWK